MEQKVYFLVVGAMWPKMEAFTEAKVADAVRVVREHDHPALGPWEVIPCIQIAGKGA